MQRGVIVYTELDTVPTVDIEMPLHDELNTPCIIAMITLIHGLCGLKVRARYYGVADMDDATKRPRVVLTIPASAVGPVKEPV